VLLVPLRMFLIPRMPLTDEELMILDGPTASSFVSDFHRSDVSVAIVGTVAFLRFIFIPIHVWSFLLICVIAFPSELGDLGIRVLFLHFYLCPFHVSSLLRTIFSFHNTSAKRSC
jgi:hypothetical protein